MMIFSLVIVCGLISSLTSVQGISVLGSDNFVAKVKEFFDKNTDHKGALNFNKWFKDNLEDPFIIKDQDVDKPGTFNSYKASFRNMSMSGLKNFKIERVEVNVGSMDFNATFRIPFAQITGDYHAKGSMVLLPFSGSGPFSMNYTDLMITAKAQLNISKNVQVSSVRIDILPGEIDVFFGDFSALSNTVLNLLSGVLFDRVKEETIPKVESRMKLQLNDQLRNVNLTSLQPTSNSMVDEWIEQSRGIIIEKRFDPFSLPEYSRNSTANLMVMKLDYSIFLNNGTLKGLSTLIRTGPIKAIYTEDALILEVNMGFKNLRAKYDWQFNVQKMSRAGNVTCNASKIAAFVRVTQPLIRGSPPTIDLLRIEKLEYLRSDISGLGRLDNVLEIILNLVTNAMRKSIRNALSDSIVSVMKDQLTKTKLTFI